METQQAVDVIDSPRRIAAVIPPLRRRILQHLEPPDSASGLARRMGLTRQKLNYHLRELEREGFVELAEKRQRRGCVERRLRPTARAYLISPAVLGRLSADPEQVRDRFSSTYLAAVAGRLLEDVARLRQRADAVGRRLVTTTMQTEISFRSPAEMAAFNDELTDRLRELTEKYHQPTAEGARVYRFVLGGHPKITKTEREAAIEAFEQGKEEPS